MIYVAFHKNNDSLYGKLISWWTDSIYSHCEIYNTNGDIMYGVPLDASKVIKRSTKFSYYDTNRWEFVKTSLTEAEVVKFFAKTQHNKYDWLGILLSQIFPFGKHKRAKYFCSEWVAELLGYANPQTYSPADVYERLMK